MRYIALFLACFSAAGAFSQDQLFRKDNSKTEVKILEVTPNEIRYKLFTYQDGPIITVLKSEVALVIYQNGTHETFNTPPAVQSQPVMIYSADPARLRAKQRVYEDSMRLVRYREATSAKNLLSLNLLEPLNGSFGVSYLREFADGLFHVYVPVSAGFSEPYFNQLNNTVFGSRYYNGVANFKFNRKSFEGGLGFHIHTSGKRLVTHFIGPYIGISQFKGRYDSYTYDPNYYGPQQQSYLSHNFVMNRYTFMLDNGILFRIHKNFSMILLAGFGYHSDDYLSNNPENYVYKGYGNYYQNTFPINSFKLNVSVGYRF